MNVSVNKNNPPIHFRRQQQRRRVVIVITLIALSKPGLNLLDLTAIALVQIRKLPREMCELHHRPQVADRRPAPLDLGDQVFPT